MFRDPHRPDLEINEGGVALLVVAFVCGALIGIPVGMWWAP
jgi:hypothetical protein